MHRRWGSAPGYKTPRVFCIRTADLQQGNPERQEGEPSLNRSSLSSASTTTRRWIQDAVQTYRGMMPSILWPRQRRRAPQPPRRWQSKTATRRHSHFMWAVVVHPQSASGAMNNYAQVAKGVFVDFSAPRRTEPLKANTLLMTARFRADRPRVGFRAKTTSRELREDGTKVWRTSGEPHAVVSPGPAQRPLCCESRYRHFNLVDNFLSSEEGSSHPKPAPDETDYKTAPAF